MDIAEIHDELVEELRYALGYIADARPIADLGEIFDGFSEQFEALGLCRLLDAGDETRFREALARSGHARRFFLRRSRFEKNTEDRHLALSRTRAFLASLAAGCLPLARDIAVMSDSPWNPAWEYEDDFCYYRFLHILALHPDPFPTSESAATLNRFERSLEEGESSRFEICKALSSKSVLDFSAALRTLLEAEDAANDEKANPTTEDEALLIYWPNRTISIEGLGLLKAGELLGMNVPQELPLCPAIARLPWTDETFRDLFEEIERLP